MKYLKTLLLAVFAGICIALGGVIFPLGRKFAES